MSWGIVAGSAIGAGAAYFGGKEASKGNEAALAVSREQYQQGRTDLAPYREFGDDELESLRNWLASPEGTFRPPTQEEVEASPGYATRLGAIENSAISRGGLFSGNALRDVGEFGASEYDRTYARNQNTYQNELAKRMGFANLGYGAAGGSAGLAQNFGQQAAGLYQQGGRDKANMYSDIGGSVAGGIGAYQGQQDWNAFLDRAYPQR